MVYAAPLLCATVALWALVFGQGLTERADSTDAGAAESLDGTVAESSDAADAGTSSTVLDEAVKAVEDALADDSLQETTADRFLSDLESDVSEATGAGESLEKGSPAGKSSAVAREASCVASVSWTEQASLPRMAAGVLRSYEEAGGFRLISSGYLDLKGNVWAALLQGPSGDADFVLVTTGDDEESAARVVRLRTEGEL